MAPSTALRAEWKHLRRGWFMGTHECVLFRFVAHPRDVVATRAKCGGLSTTVEMTEFGPGCEESKGNGESQRREASPSAEWERLWCASL